MKQKFQLYLFDGFLILAASYVVLTFYSQKVRIWTVQLGENLMYYFITPDESKINANLSETFWENEAFFDRKWLGKEFQYARRPGRVETSGERAISRRK